MEKSKGKSKAGNHTGQSQPRPAVKKRSSTVPATGLVSLDFEIRGKVQGVHFRKYTHLKAKSLSLRGWCQNTTFGTVIGTIQGPRLQVDMMKDWLRRTGSPKSRIEGAEFKHIKSISEFTYEDFVIIK